MIKIPFNAAYTLEHRTGPEVREKVFRGTYLGWQYGILTFEVEEAVEEELSIFDGSGKESHVVEIVSPWMLIDTWRNSTPLVNLDELLDRQPPSRAF